MPSFWRMIRRGPLTSPTGHEAGEWVAETGEPIRTTPSSHWHPMPGDNYLPLKHGGSSSLSQAGSTNLRMPYVTATVAARLRHIFSTHRRLCDARRRPAGDRRAGHRGRTPVADRKIPRRPTDWHSPAWQKSRASMSLRGSEQTVEASKSREQEGPLENLANELAKAARPNQ